MAAVAIAAATGGCFKCAVKVVDQLINSLFFVRVCLFDMPPYIAGPHPWADKFVSRDFSDGFGQLAFVYRGPPANQLDGSFLIRFVCKEIPHHSRFSLGIESRDPYVPSCRHRVPQRCTPARGCYAKLKRAGSLDQALRSLINWRKR